MINRYLFHLLYLGFILTVSSCTMRFYAPTTIQTPLFRKKGETQVSVNLGTGEDARCKEIQAACAITPKLAVFGSYYMAEGQDHIHDDGNGPFKPDPYGRGTQFEIATGYYKTYSKSNSFETFLGLANGQAFNYYGHSYYVGPNKSLHYLDAELSNKIFKPFAQFNIGYRSPYIDVIVSSRLALLHYYKVIEKVNIPKEWDQWGGYTDYGTIPGRAMMRNPNSFLFEPGVSVRVGCEPVKIQFHIGYSINRKMHNQENIILSIGLVGKLFSSKSKEKWNE